MIFAMIMLLLSWTAIFFVFGLIVGIDHMHKRMEQGEFYFGLDEWPSDLKVNEVAAYQSLKLLAEQHPKLFYKVKCKLGKKAEFLEDDLIYQHERRGK